MFLASRISFAYALSCLVMCISINAMKRDRNEITEEHSKKLFDRAKSLAIYRHFQQQKVGVIEQYSCFNNADRSDWVILVASKVLDRTNGNISYIAHDDHNSEVTFSALEAEALFNRLSLLYTSSFAHVTSSEFFGEVIIKQ